MDPDEVLALELHQGIVQHGWERVSTLLTLRFTPSQAEALYHRLEVLETVLPQLQQAFQARREPGGN